MAPYLAEEKPITSLRLKDWLQAMEHLRIKLPGQAFRKYVTEELSWPLTLIAAICKFNLDSKTKLCIHIMGATERYMSQGYVTDLLELFPLPETEIVIVGPDVSKTDVAMQYMNTSGNTVCVTPVVACYHAYTSRSEFVLPDLVVAFHPGLQAKTYDWKPTLRFLVSKHVPTVFTCWNERELEDHAMILSCEDIKADIRTKGDAPFPSSLKRHLSASTGKNETIFMVMNSYWITFKGGQCISMLRGGEKEYQEESGKAKAKEMFNGVIWLWEEHHGSRVSLPPMLKRVTSRAYNNLAIIAVKEEDIDGAVKMGEKAD